MGETDPSTKQDLRIFNFTKTQYTEKEKNKWLCVSIHKIIFTFFEFDLLLLIFFFLYVLYIRCRTNLKTMEKGCEKLKLPIPYSIHITTYRIFQKTGILLKLLKCVFI